MVKAVTFSYLLVASCTILVIFDFVQCLLELSNENTNTKNSEDIISYTINKLFEILKLKDEDYNSSAKQYSELHKYFVSTSSHYQDNLQDMSRAIMELNKDSTDTFVYLNNFIEGSDILDNKKILNKNDEYVLKYIDEFLSNLQEFKDKFHSQDDYDDLNNDTNILNFIMKDYEELHNLTKSYESDVSDENDFWEESGRRIFKGERSKIRQFPFMASIQLFNNFHCAGSIIKSDLIVTASSCLQLAWNNRFFRENPAFLSARVGSSFYNVGGEVIPILEIYFHPGYNPKTLQNNICVLRLIRHLKFRRRSKSIKKIDFDRNENSLSTNTPGITVVGWGAKKKSTVIGNPWQNIISYSVLDIYPLKDCQDVYFKNFVTNKHFCAGFISRGGGACNKDVGGPGIVAGKLMGVISFGSPVCGMPDAPTVFTKLGYYADWIEQIMEQDVPVSQKRTTLKPYRAPFELPASTLRPTTTTFKIEPITGKTMTPIPIYQIERQNRNDDDDDLKQFLELFFNSKEIEEYKDILKVSNKSLHTYEDNLKIDDTENNEQVTESYEVSKMYTKIDKYSSEQSDTEKYTTADNISGRDYSDNDVVKLMEKVNLDKIVKEEMAKTKVSSELLPKNESVLTLLYISDDEKNAYTKEISKENVNSDHINEGMSIAVDNFEDLTRAKKQDYILPENDLYGLLSEMIGEEMQKINTDAL